MKFFRMLVCSLVLTLSFTILTFAQTEKLQHISSGKIFLINSIAFRDEKIGIKELVDAYNKVKTELKPQETELRLLHETIKKLEKELEDLSRRIEPPHYATKEWIDNKIKELEAAICKYQSKQAIANSLFENRALELSSSVKKRIAETLNKFARENEYDIILDISEIGYSYTLINFPNYKDVTKDFIKFYNNNINNK